MSTNINPAEHIWRARQPQATDFAARSRSYPSRIDQMYNTAIAAQLPIACVTTAPAAEKVETQGNHTTCCKHPHISPQQAAEAANTLMFLIPALPNIEAHTFQPSCTPEDLLRIQKAPQSLGRHSLSHIPQPSSINNTSTMQPG